ncbi:DUF3093 family protein [Brevibacterium sp. 5221]|uniref:DUF3093 family protein n=1 Tax=Brevibacterium rongguiense TaxID=2695267 RepID=A0A6N9H9N1_9MICO|nr:DUF3093 domain-containing protein [Brevibacterium rongguiense]MYM20758.1 DUF3093 family protein [Brevibacterium rongguiense]
MAPQTHTGSTVRYSERLGPTPAWWFVAAVLAAMTAVMVYPVWHWGGLIVPLITFALLVLALRATIKSVVVTDRELYAGVAHIERALVGEVTPLDKQQAFEARGFRLDARAFLMTRPWIGPAVRIDIADPADPTPYWIVSTRRPEELAAALRG